MDISYEKSSSHVPNNVMDWDNTLNNIQDEQETITVIEKMRGRIVGSQNSINKPFCSFKTEEIAKFTLKKFFPESTWTQQILFKVQLGLNAKTEVKIKLVKINETQRCVILLDLFRIISTTKGVILMILTK